MAVSLSHTVCIILSVSSIFLYFKTNINRFVGFDCSTTTVFNCCCFHREKRLLIVVVYLCICYFLFRFGCLCACVCVRVIHAACWVPYWKIYITSSMYFPWKTRNGHQTDDTIRIFFIVQFTLGFGILVHTLQQFSSVLYDTICIKCVRCGARHAHTQMPPVHLQ